jgi:uncharacterized glyoxalase superfamily protein PhnB
MIQLRICIDVPDLDRGIAFYQQAFGFTVARRLGSDLAELAGAAVPIDLLGKPLGSAATPIAPATRTYDRHWTPVHLDLVVRDLEPALERAIAAGATLEGPIANQAWGQMANLADPFGHGICLLQFRGRGEGGLLAPT